MAKISDLRFDDKNFNRHTSYGMSLLEKSLNKFGAGRSILIDKNNNIIAGNGIIEAAGQAGLENVKIVESDGKKIIAVKRTDIDLNSEEGREMALADNATTLVDIKWDDQNLAEAFDEQKLGEWGVFLGSEVDWASVKDLNDENYEEPEHEMLECPACHHIDRKIHFKKVDEQK